MKNNNVFFYMFIILWVMLVIFNFCAPKKVFSEQENRYLAKMPEFSMDKLISGEYSNEMNDYINDHFVFRDIWVKINSFTQISTGKTENNGVYIGKDGYLFEKVEMTEKEKNNLEFCAQKMNTIAGTLDIPVYSMIVPNSIFINQDKLPEYVTSYNQDEVIEEMYLHMGNIENINVIDSIAQKNKIEQLYFKTDHHMTSDGSYVLYKEFTDELGITYYNDFVIEEVSNEFLGTFDAKAQVFNQEKDNIEVYKNSYNQDLDRVVYDYEITKSIFNEEYLGKRDKYSYFLNGNNSKVEIYTKQDNGRKLLLIKDSYSHNFIQFICGNFEEIHIIDPRYYRANIKDYVEENDITEVLFLYNISNLSNDIGLRNIR